MNRNLITSLTMAMTIGTMFLTSTTLQANETDDKIEASFKQSYVYRTYLKDDDFEAEADDGVVTLSGTVAEESHKSLARETLVNINGVTKVVDNLSTTAEVAADNADTKIERKVKLALLFHRHVSYLKTTVTSKDGIVTITGEATNAAEKELTTEYVSDIDGVKGVNNEMTLALLPVPAERTAGEKIDDASVTAQVSLALLTHRSTSAISTKAVTREGVVTVTGIANNAAEKALVTKLVKDTKGVTSVDNKMTISKATTK